ncbi:hypothetical protein FGIG_10800 [Fasciola gigantica]|uniref:Uncharacterized protein n=1 Tax=Fasciola gigantica TaxID=46835 RepID=A0A504YFA0_FASGI|nr:hypothetical protein FGIG_10800 [Fasciola gigantica]
MHPVSWSQNMFMQKRSLGHCNRFFVDSYSSAVFEIQIAAKLPLDDLDSEAVEDPEPYAQWDPTCYEVGN